MVMNKKSQVMFYVLMLSIVIIIITLAFAPVIKSFINDAQSKMTCSDNSISDFDKATCISFDIIFFLIVLFGLGIALVILRAKVMT